MRGDLTVTGLVQAYEDLCAWSRGVVYVDWLHSDPDDLSALLLEASVLEANG